MDFEVGVAAQKIPQEAQADSAERQLLYFKERFVGEDHPGRQVMEGFSVKLRKLGFDATTIGRGPVRPELDAMLATKGLDENLNLRRRVTRPTAP